MAKSLLELPPPPGQKRFERLDGYAENGRGLDIAKPLLMNQGDRRPLALGKGTDRLFHAMGDLGFREPSLGVRRRARGVGYLIDIDRSAPPTQPVDALVIRDAVEPGREPRLGPPAASVPPQPQERFLRHIIRFRAIGEEAPREPGDRIEMALDHQTERSPIPIRDPRHQSRFVIGLRGPRHRSRLLCAQGRIRPAFPALVAALPPYPRIAQCHRRQHSPETADAVKSVAGPGAGLRSAASP